MDLDEPESEIIWNDYIILTVQDTKTLVQFLTSYNWFFAVMMFLHIKHNYNCDQTITGYNQTISPVISSYSLVQLQSFLGYSDQTLKH